MLGSKLIHYSKRGPRCCYATSYYKLQSWQGNVMTLSRHYDDVMMGAMASQITSLTIVYSTVYRVLHTPVGAAIEWAIVRRFSEACLAEVTDRIRNQVLVNRLTATSSKITKISWLEMLVNYRRNYCWLSWQISRLTFTCEHVQFEWLCLLHPAN